MSDPPSDPSVGTSSNPSVGTSSDLSIDADAARDRLCDTHSERVAATLDCAAAVAAGFETTVGGDPATRESRAVRSALRAALDRAGLLEAFAALLPDLVDAAGGTMAAPPVAGPPYVTVTSTGPVLRATLGGTRLVVRIEAFAVVDGAFVWRDPSPSVAVRAVVRG
ncbi:hypothetical protein [Halorubrum sp. JWXQ-INN 858]|uniref:hypothetical protein n=1 Tax=Halorubrum sp. JWXQ-INN 858 TaxID=2690782 RepID=UPI00190F9F4A|nr:hypothetical protein [Halorubrum sp. JWXQ-INN 858]